MLVSSLALSDAPAELLASEITGQDVDSVYNVHQGVLETLGKSWKVRNNIWMLFSQSELWLCRLGAH